ncbi:DNA repair protein RecO [Prosthecochloris sp. N3]|uniref:DNA repair protein RecO n=1 Tax=Prosthecochloris ethylica TaxID=2743976 RepID=A0ABR9XRB5_9CHLB|nr:DNA repair protein RecO [Prosthecochloris sp. ZM_2]MBF0586345.1 DNA repair protein RecO [Prosthecochloris ethylica]MBF0636437.1 DNA repair protein RecO [Prosthecochloris ethylica]NUK47611.1 DNA repair protein RecO [Prosthecochloris ethylica]
MLEKTRGFVLREVKFRDQSKICQLFTERFGTISVILKGVRSPKNRMSGLFSTGNMVELVLYRKHNRDLHLVRDARLLHSPLAAMPDLERFSAMYRLVETLREVTGTEEPYPALFGALALALEQICRTGEHDYEMMLAWFLARMASILGFEPEIDRCVLSGRPLRPLDDDAYSNGFWLLTDPGGIALTGPGSTSSVGKQSVSADAYLLLCTLCGRRREMPANHRPSHAATMELSNLLQDYCTAQVDHQPHEKNRRIISRLLTEDGEG